MWWITKYLFFVFYLGTGHSATKTSFSCNDRPSGYYADVSTGCQVYHMCDGIGRQFSYTCPNATLFQQRMLICDHWYMVNCTRAEADYGANLLIGQQKPFVDDAEYYRTPRPDLLTASRNKTEANIIYRTGRKQTPSQVVGIETKIGDLTSQNENIYFPPSHWSTNNGQEPVPTPSIPVNAQSRNDNDRQEGAKAINSGSFLNRNGNYGNGKFNSKVNSKGIPALIRTRPDTGNGRPNVVFGSNFKATTPVYPLSVDPTSEEPGLVGIQVPGTRHSVSNVVNFGSNFKATTPVYPETVEPTSPEPNSIGLLPPKNVDDGSNIFNNFESNFKATTPVYPLSVDSTSPNPDNIGLLPPKGNNREDLSNIRGNFKNNFETSSNVRVNFESNFKATTPVYPLSVDSTSPNPDHLGLLAPKGSEREDLSKAPVIFESNFKATTPVYPSSVDSTSSNPNSLGLLPPKDVTGENLSIPVNFESNFKATTPVYPHTVEPTSPNPNVIGLIPPDENFIPHKNVESSFKATTPVYPKFVESTSIDPSLAGLLAPERSNGNSKVFDSNFHATTPVFPTSAEERVDDENFPPQASKTNSNVPSLTLDILPPKFDETYKLNRDPNIETTVSPPSKFYQVPKLEPDFTIAEEETNNQLGIKINNFMKSLSGSQWHSLREQFKIPEYEFPLEENGRPNYEGTLNSFDAKQVKKKK